MNEQTSPSLHDEPPRRVFFKKVLAVFTFLAAISVSLASGVAVLIDPLRRRRTTGGIEIEVTSLDALAEDGLPRRIAVRADYRNAWSHQSNVPIGAVYLRRTGPDQVVAFNVVCPHAGCFVKDNEDGTFVCPCHESEFDADGKIVPITRDGGRTVSPRDLDTLSTRIQDGKVFVRFQNFYAGSSEKIPRS